MSSQPRILIIEDRADWQKLLQHILEREQFETHLAGSFEEAVAALKAQPFDLALVDIVLDDSKPRFDRSGLSVIQKIREIQENLPLMIVTGSLAKDVSASLARLCPDAPILIKENFDRAQFLNQVRELVGGEPVDAALPPEMAEVAASPEPLPEPPQKPKGRPGVLLVENRSSWQKIVVRTLVEADYFWRVVSTAEEALEILGRISFHVVILDLKLQAYELPLRSSEGWLLLDHLVEARLKTKVIILSGRAQADEAVDLVTKYPIIIDFIQKQHFTGQKVIEAVTKATKVPNLRLQTLGRFQVWRDGQPIGVWDRPQAETLTKLLLVRRAQGGHTVAADELITYLWPDSDEASGRKKLLPLISSARHTLEPDIEPRHSNFIVRDSNGYYFELNESVSWDLLTFREHLKQGRLLVQGGRWTEAIVALKKGKTLYQGDFMAEDLYSDWIIEIRREIARDFRDLLIYLADAYAQQEQYRPAIAACEAALQKDPLLESAYRRLMRLYSMLGEKGQALKVYRDCLKLFEELFGESPTPATRRLRQAIANDEGVEYELEPTQPSW